MDHVDLWCRFRLPAVGAPYNRCLYSFDVYYIHMILSSSVYTFSKNCVHVKLCCC